MLSDQEQTQLNSFLSVTGCEDVDRAIEILRTNDWNIENAINFFYGGTGAVVAEEAVVAEAGPSTRAVPGGQANGASSHSNTRPGSLLSWLLKIFWYLVENSFNLLFLPLKLLLGPTREENSASALHQQLTEQFGREKLPVFQEDPKQSLADFIGRNKDALNFTLVYIHQSSHGHTQRFLSDYLANENFVAFLAQTPRIKTWVASISDSLGKQAAQDLNVLKFPFLALVSPVSDLKSALVEEGDRMTPLPDLIVKWSHYVANQTSSISRVQRERQERDLARRLRDEQNAAYEASLQADREKAKQQSLKKQQEAEAKARADQKRQEKKTRRQKRQEARDAIVLPPEADGSSSVCRISIRYPNGNRLIRKFATDTPIKTLYDFCEKSGNLDLDFEYVICSHFPRVEFPLEEKGSVSLETAGLVPSANLFVEEVEVDSSAGEEEIH